MTRWSGGLPGCTLQGWWDGALALQTVEPFQMNATRHGLDWNSAFDATTTYENFALCVWP